MKLKHRKKRTCPSAIAVILILTLAVMPLTACKGIPMATEAKEIKAYSKPQAMIIVATERNRYQEAYRSQIWGVKLPDGESFEKYLLAQVQEFLQEMKRMDLLAKKKGITVTNGEKEELRRLSAEYFKSLTKADVAYMGITQDDVSAVYDAYFLANKVVKELTEAMDLEISDSDAKVIDVDVIALADQSAAQTVLGLVHEEGADFEGIARKYSEDSTIRKQIAKGAMPVEIEKGAFCLAAGEVSPAIESGGKYYVIKCVSDYDEAATQARKERLYLQRKKEAFQKVYDQFNQENPVTFNQDIWDGLHFSKEDKTTTTNFFELYKKYFPGY